MPTFRRLLLSPERLPEALKRVQDGVLVRLPVAEFDALVERAAKAKVRKSPPQLLEARYHAVLKEECLIGEGQWKLVHAGPGPGLLSLQPFNLALRQARFENGDALIAAFDGKTPALLVETPGERTVSLDWSARAESSPEGLQFHLEMPPCPVALLELDVPAGRAVTVLNDGALLSGPHEAERADLRRWKIVCGGRQRIARQRADIRIHPADRPVAGTDSPPTPFVHQKTTQKLHPEGLDATFELTLDGFSRGIRELICECDAELRVRDVVGPGVDGWTLQAGDGNKPARLAIALGEPVRAGTWKVLCLAPLNDGILNGGSGGSPVPNRPPGSARPIVWRSPGLRLVNGVSRGETLTLWLHPDLRVESWDPGSYRLSSSDLDRATEAQVLTLLGGGSAGLPRRPSARLHAYGVEFSTQQLTWWRCNVGGMALTVQIGWDVSQGQLFQLPVLLPAGWQVEKVEMAPAALLRNWHVRKVGGKATLFVDLARPLGPRPSTENEGAGEMSPRSPPSSSPRGGAIRGRARLPALTVYLRPTRAGMFTEKRLRFPDAAPLGARFRDGALALTCDARLFHLSVKTSAKRTEPESDGPWGQQLPEYYYRYHGQPVAGEIQVRPRPPRLQAKCKSDVLVAGGEAVVETHLLLEAEAGIANTIELSLSTGDGGEWQWHTEVPTRGEEPSVNRVRRVERVYRNETSTVMHLLAASHPLQAAVIAAARPTGELWLLKLSQPLRVREPLRLKARRRLQPRNNRWEVPLPIVVGAERMEGEVVLHPADSGLAPVHTVGLRDFPSTLEKGAAPRRTFRYGQGEVSLTLSGEARAFDRSSAKLWEFASIGSARLITFVGRNGMLRHHYSFQVANWGEHNLPLRLPPGSQVLAVQIDGRWLPRLLPNSQTSPGDENTEPIELALPVPSRTVPVSADNFHLFEIVYTNTVPVGGLWQSLDEPVPSLPIAPIVFHRVWRLPPQLTPLHQERYQSQPGTINQVPLPALPRRFADLFHLPSTWARFDPLLREPISEGSGNDLAGPTRHEPDASGRLHSAPSPPHPENAAGSAGARLPALDFEYEGEDWSEWEPIAGRADERLIVVRRDGVTAIGLALGLSIVLLLGLIRRRSAHHCLMFLLPALAFSGLGVLWLPASLRDLAWWPLLASGAVAVLMYLGTIISKPTRPQPGRPQQKNAGAAAAVAGMFVLGILGWNGRAAPPAPATVYLVPASVDASDKQMVLAPADLLDRLKALARPAPLALSGPQTVLLDALYEGQLVEEGKQAEFVAVFAAHSLSDQPSTLIVPLAGVQLVGEVLLDGARVAPLAAPQAGYSLPVRGRGRHKIELHFRVPVVGTEEDRNVLFTAPPLVRSRLSWHVPSGAVGPQVLVKNGAQWTTRDSGQYLEADLGALPLPVHLHWYQPSRPTRVSYQAAYLWDLGLEANRLTAWLRYRVAQGAIKTLEVNLPEELEVSSANAQRTSSVSRPSWRPRFQLHDWQVKRAGNKRVLHLELPYPVSGDFQVTLELLPRAPLTSPTPLPLPRPRGIRAGGPHYLAYRTQPGLNAQYDTSQNLTRIDNNDFAPDWGVGPSLETDFHGIAYRIPPNRSPQLFLRLQHKPPLVQGDVDVTVRAGAQRAEMEAIAEITAPNKDLAAIEWELPPRCLLAAATGANVRTWKQNGSRLLVWLNRTTTKTRIHLSGWLPLSLRGGHPHLELSGPRLLHADKQHTRLRLAASDNLILAAVRTRNLQPAEDAGRPADAGRSSTFETWNSSYHLDCQVQSAARAVARVLTRAVAADHELRFTTTVDYTVIRGELRQVRLRLRNWEEEKVEVQAEHVALWSGPRLATGERSWLLPLQAGVRGHYQLTLHGNMPLDKAAGGVPMPEVLVEGVDRAEYFVAVTGKELTSQAKGALQALKTEAQKPKTDPTIADLLRQGGRVWHINGSEWQVRLLPQPKALQPTPVQIYLLEQGAAVVDGRRWLHEVRCWVHHEAHANLTLDFAAPARILAASVDGVEATPQFSVFGVRLSDANESSSSSASENRSRLWLPLPDRPGVSCIRLRWMYGPPEPLDRPNLTPPQLAGAITRSTLSTVMVPTGWDLSLDGASSWQGTTREAELALWRADAQLRIRRDLAKERKDSVVTAALAAAQQRFDLFCRRARHALVLSGEVAAAGPQGQSLVDWLNDLQAKDRLLKSEIRNPKSEIRNPKSEIPLSDSDFGFQISGVEKAGGTPVSWQTLPTAGPLTLHLTSQERQRTRQTLIASAEWLGVLAVVWILSILPFSRTRLHLFWPEQIALLSAIGWHLAGLTSIVLGLLLLAVCSRAFLLIHSLRAFVRRRRLQPSTTTAGNDFVG